MTARASDDEERALAANEAFYRAFNAKDPDAMERVWAADGDVTCIHPGWMLIEGRDAVVESWRSILTNPGQATIVIGGAQATIRGDVAIVICRELVAGSPLVATNVFARREGEWRLLHHQSGPVYAQ